jgi:hypothetical protein
VGAASGPVAQHDLHLIRVAEVRRGAEGRRQRRHRCATRQHGGEGADLAARDERFVGLDVDHMVCAHEAVGFGEAIGAALVGDAGEDCAEPGFRHAAAQEFVVDGEMEREFGGFARQPLRHPAQQGFAADDVQEFAGKAGRLEAAGDDDRGEAHRVQRDLRF